MTLDELAQPKPLLPIGVSPERLKVADALADRIASTQFSVEPGEPSDDEFVEM
jgi:hypothetical protein